MPYFDDDEPSRTLSDSDLTAVAELLRGTSDDLEEAVSQIGIDPATVYSVRRDLLHQEHIRQCQDCAAWYSTPSKGGCPDCKVARAATPS